MFLKESLSKFLNSRKILDEFLQPLNKSSTIFFGEITGRYSRGDSKKFLEEFVDKYNGGILKEIHREIFMNF